MEWNFIKCCLRKYGFRDNFLRWVDLLYTDIFNSVILNGWFTENICPSRGIRQGCPLSALLFILAVEVIANKIRNDNNIHGIEIGHLNKEIKICQLADDMTLFMNNINSGNVAIQLIDEFGGKAGVILNKQKTKALWLGECQPVENVLDIPWEDRFVKCLGIYFSRSKQISRDFNWSEDKVLNIKRTLDMWKNRYLTYKGKIIILKTFILSKLVYTAHVILCPVDMIKRIDKLLFEFLWGSSVSRVKKSNVINDTSKGGLNMIDLSMYFNSVKLKWFSKFVDVTKGKWKWIFEYWLQKIGGVKVVLNCRCDPKFMLSLQRKLPGFYCDILYTYFWYKQEFYFKDILALNSSEEISKEMLWLNTHIRYNGEMLIFNNWIKSGILFVGDILDENGIMPMSVLKEKLQYLDGRLFSEYGKCCFVINNLWSIHLRNNDVDAFKTFVSDTVNENGNNYNFENTNISPKIKSRVIYQQLR